MIQSRLSYNDDEPLVIYVARLIDSSEFITGLGVRCLGLRIWSLGQILHVFLEHFVLQTMQRS